MNSPIQQQAGAAGHDRETLLQSLEPLPLTGTAWPRWTKALAWLLVTIIGVQLVRTASGPAGAEATAAGAASIVVAFVGLLIMARYIQVSRVIITREGIEQTWFTRRTIRWDDIHYAKFVPLPASRRLICFTRRNRPVIFQAGTPELSAAFARIAIAYRRRGP